MSATFRGVVLLCKDVLKSTHIFERGVGLRVAVCNPNFAELTSSDPHSDNDPKIFLYKVQNEASSTTGYSPFLSFHVTDVQTHVQRLLELGASLDGPIQFTDQGQVAALRSPDGHMIGLIEKGPS